MPTILEDIRDIIVRLQMQEVRDDLYDVCSLCGKHNGHHPDCIWLKARLMVEHAVL
jgi:hypothetical protein